MTHPKKNKIGKIIDSSGSKSGMDDFDILNNVKNNPLSKRYKPIKTDITPSPKQINHSNASDDASVRAEIEKEVAARQMYDEKIYHKNKKDFDVAKSLSDDARNQYDEAVIDLDEFKDMLDKFRKNPTPAPPRKEAAKTVSKMILTNLIQVKRLLTNYKGVNQTEVQSFLVKLNNKSKMEDLILLMKDPQLMKDIQFLFFKLRTSMELTRNFVARSREKGLYDLFVKMPLQNLFDPNWIPNERKKLEGNVNAQEKLVRRLADRWQALQDKTDKLEQKTNEFDQAPRNKQTKHPLTSTSAGMFKWPTKPLPTKPAENRRASTLIKMGGKGRGSKGS